MELYELTALELAQKLRTGEVTQQEAVEAARARIDAAQRSNNAFLTLTGPAPAADPSASPLAGVPMALIAVWVRLDSPGPALYRQERLGLNGKSFWIYKFRSMRVDAEANGAQWAEEHDDRVTRAGRFLRKTRLDELPQLLNILRGQMSLVGPRPERPCFYAEFEKYIHGFSQRMVVKPGLTGLAQVSGGYDLLPEEKIQFDMQYIRERSIALDLKCILRTIGVVFDHNGAR